MTDDYVPIKKRPLGITTYSDEESGASRRGITVDGVLFDWSMSTNSEMELYSRMADTGTVKAVRAETMRAFLRHFGEFLGRDVTIRELNEAIRNGWIGD